MGWLGLPLTVTVARGQVALGVAWGLALLAGESPTPILPGSCPT